MLQFLQELWKQDPQFFNALLEILKFGVTILTTIIGGVWVLSKWLTEQRTQRNERMELEESKLKQQQLEEKHRREDRAADLIRDFSGSENEQGRLSTAMALALYPDEALPILVNSLAYVEDGTASAMEIVMASIGVSALSHLAKMNRVAYISFPRSELSTKQPPTSLNQEKILSRTKFLIETIIRLNSGESSIEFDTTELDLSGIKLQELQLKGIYFRKTILDEADFTGTNLRGSRFRGSSLIKTKFTHADLRKADFTGSEGMAIFTRANAEEAIFDHVHFGEALFQGTNLKSVSFQGASLEKSDFSGATIGSTALHGANLNQAKLYKTFLDGAQMDDCEFTSSDFQQAQINKSQASKSRFNRAVFDHASLEMSVFVQCDFGGGAFNSCRMHGVQFIDCNLGGAKFNDCVLEEGLFKNCEIGSTTIQNSRLKDAKFEGNNRWHPTRTRFTGSNWEEASFDEANAELKKWLQTNFPRGQKPEMN